jgi:hypothetical protein
MKLSETCLFILMNYDLDNYKTIIFIIDKKVSRIRSKDKFLGQITNHLNEF